MKTSDFLSFASFYLLLAHSAAFAGMENKSCWKGHSQAAQKKALANCRAAKGEGQRCETNLFKHGQGAYDVCLRGLQSEPTQVIKCINGRSPAQQTANLRLCETLLADNQVCISNLRKHRHAAYDVCVMAAADPLDSESDANIRVVDFTASDTAAD